MFADSSVPDAVLTRFDQEMAQGKVAAALTTGMKGAKMGPAIFNVLPRWLLQRLTTMAMAGEDKATGDYVTMRMLAPTTALRLPAGCRDERGAGELQGALRTDVLLLGGSKSPAYLKAALDALESVLLHASRVEFPGLDHAATWNADRGGKPEPVARELRRFLNQPVESLTWPRGGTRSYEWPSSGVRRRVAHSDRLAG